jgi:prepilin-type processing-associated H-X9-DG protein
MMLKALGGRDGLALLAGNYTIAQVTQNAQMTPYYGGSWANDYNNSDQVPSNPAAGAIGNANVALGRDGVAVGCMYAYRCQPVTLGCANTAGISSGYPTSLNFPFTKPMISTAQNCPIFKTDKALGGRMIVSDRFGVSDWSPPGPVGGPPGGSETAASRALIPGDGLYLHKDGYNVLYGDGSAQWYSDPKQQIIWTRKPADTKTGASPPWGGLSMVAYDVCNTGTYPDCIGAWSQGALLPHQFDMSRGIDIMSSAYDNDTTDANCTPSSPGYYNSAPMRW